VLKQTSIKFNYIKFIAKNYVKQLELAATYLRNHVHVLHLALLRTLYRSLFIQNAKSKMKN